MYKLINILMSALVVALSGFSGLSYAAPLNPLIMNNNAAVPPSIIDAADPNVMINLSIERPMIGAAYNDQDDNGGYCAGRDSNDGICYITTKDYLGYFNPRLCYDYSGGTFSPAGPTNSDHSCNGVSGGWSGNFLNWSTMTAIDEFRWILTGGHRSTDTAGTTVLERGNMDLPVPHNWFPYKRLSTSNTSPYNVAPSTVTPYSSSTIYIYSSGIGFGVSSGRNTSANLSVGLLNARVQVCDGTFETETSTYRRCIKYGSNLKPEGLIQKNAGSMRFAVMSYLLDASPSRDGGVLRARMKYVGQYRPAAGGGIELNSPGQEFSEVNGTFIVDPAPADSLASGVTNSGVINYINKFGANGYKSRDPIGELFYECINYYKGRGATPDYTAGIGAGDVRLDGFPAITNNWVNPIEHACQQNYIVAINDANPWYDKRLPGTDVITQTQTNYPDTANAGTDMDFGNNPGYGGPPMDFGEPTNADPDIDVTDLTQWVGDMQGITGTQRLIGCVENDCDMNLSMKTITNLGKAFGTAPADYKQNSYYIAGLAYYAASNDMSTTLDGMQTVKTFMIDTQEYQAAPLVGEMNMLWLAGKYGGFNEKNFINHSGSGTYWPDQPNEWDEDGDGSPDNYVLATDPAKLVTGLTRAFNNIEQRISSGSAAAVVSNGITGSGAFYQAIYSPRVRTVAGNEVQWVGQLHALFIDTAGRLREDGSIASGNGVLDDIATDNIVQLSFNPTVGIERTQVYRYNSQAAYDAGTPTDIIEVDDLNAIWKAREELAGLDNSSIEVQRPYSTTVSDSGSSRYIFTWNDLDGDRAFTTNERVDFTAANMDENIMAVVDDAEADNVVAFIRGKEGIPGYRSRTIEFDSASAGDDYWRLGDIVHSSPHLVGQPGSAYDISKGDTTYAAYRTQYAKRRQMVYVGANDGMLHAFNAGFFDAGSNSFSLTRAAEPFESLAPASHPLGAEIWAYVPGNLLPHMQWLKELNYPHLYYVDGSPQSFDVNIFPNDAIHPNGWGTILVVNMRFGGGTVTYDHDGDSDAITTDITASSSVVVLDITNPESPPLLLAEISDANLGFTTSKPTLVTRRAPVSGNDFNNTPNNDWYLAFGSGPIGSNALTTVTSDQNARLYLYDLKLNAFKQFGGDNYLDLNIANAFVGDMASQNWDNDFLDDVVYYGTVAGTVLAPTGGLYRVPLTSASFGTPSSLLSVSSALPNKPFSTAPSFSIDITTGDHWVYAGTGRLFVNSDNQSATQQTFYGIKDPGSGSTWGTVALSGMQDVTGLRVFSTGDMEDPGVVIPLGDITGGDITTTTDNSDFTRFRNYMAGTDGWFIDLTLGATSTRNVFSSVTFRSFIIFPEYTPPLDQCTPEGTSRLYALFFKTGTAFPAFGLGAAVPSRFNTNNDDIETAGVTEPIQGLVSSPTVYQSPGGTGSGSTGATIFSGSSPGSSTQTQIEPVLSAGGRRSWREIPLQ